MKKQHIAVFIACIIGMIAVGVALFFVLGLARTGLKSEMEKQREICRANGMDSRVVTDPAYFVQGGGGPKVICISRN